MDMFSYFNISQEALTILLDYTSVPILIVAQLIIDNGGAYKP
tara:strand:+ start:28 stop:153 length:126 start_codon:yes stop_codon:yes gene_type:complete